VRRAASILLITSGWASVACSSPRTPPTKALNDSATAETQTAESFAGLPIDSVIHLGDAAYAEDAYEKARALWRHALAQARDAKDTLREAQVLTSLGLAAWHLGALNESRSLGEEALSIKLRLGSKSELFRSYNALGLLANDQGRLEDALQLYNHAIASADANDSASIAKVANNRGLVQFAMGDYAGARAGFLEARRLGHKLGAPRIEGRALDNLAMYGSQLGDPQSALASLLDARKLMRSDGDRLGEQNALGQMGVAYGELGEPGLALAAMDSALQLSRALGLRQEEADNLELIANLHRQAGDLQRALDLYLQANRINEAIGQTGEVGTNLRSVAEIHAATGRLDLALEKANQALAIHRATRLRLEELRDELLLADLESLSGSAESRIRVHLRASDRLNAALDARVGRVEVALAKATIADRRGDARLVLDVLTAARADLARGGFGGAWQAEALRARAYARLSRLDSAVIAGKAAVAALERVRGEYRSSVLRSSFVVDKAEPYADLVNVLLRLRRPDDAFDVSDEARSHALLEHLAAKAGADEGQMSPTMRSLMEAEGMLRHIGALVSRRDSLDVAPSERDAAWRDRALAVTNELARARDEYETRLIHIGAGDPAASTMLGEIRVNPEQVRHALLPREAMLEYLVTPASVITFVVTQSEIRNVVAEASPELLARWVRAARDLAARPQPIRQNDDDALVALHNVLIAPAERAGLLRDVKRLVIVPHSVLSYVPFAALRRGRNSQFLIEEYTLLHSPSASALTVVRSEGARGASTRAQAFAPFPRELPGSVREARSFQGSIRSSSVTIGTSATEAAFRRALAAGGMVHVATHGVMNPRNPMFSRLEFANGAGVPADDGRLEAHEVLGLRVTAGLVFLSGCETGVGTAGSTQFPRGGDYATLEQAFLFAGARTVIATLWPIADEGAAAFAERFYRHVRTMAPAEALAAAQRELLGGARYAVPFYWAGYRVIGQSDYASETHSSTTTAVSHK